MNKDTFLEEQRTALGKRVKYIRIKREYRTQMAFAQHYFEHDRPSSFISRIERGTNLGFPSIIKLARKLETTIFSLFDFRNQFPLEHVIYDEPVEVTINKELQKLGKRIRQLRKQNGVAQFDLTLTSLVSNDNISDYERGKLNPEFDTISRIAYGFGVDLLTLVNYKE